MDKRMLLILNPSAGQRRANRVMPEIIRTMNDNGYRCEVFVTADRGDATRVTAQSAQEFDRIVCIGGDGTLNETIKGLIEAGHEVPLGYIPTGSTNDFAATLGLSMNCLSAAEDAASCEPLAFDIGTFNGRPFVYTASCGAFTRVSYSAPQSVKNTLGHFAYLLEGIRDLSSLRPYPMRVTLGSQVIEKDFIFLSVTNSTSVGGIIKLDPRQVALNDGRFEVLLVVNPTNPAQLRDIIMSLTTMEVPNDMVYFTTASRMLVEMDPDTEWTLDGERQEGAQQIEILNCHSAIHVAVPRLPHDLEEDF
ncbi:MAG: YegS/Rv2252/BmrU family lipid kinase [Clostridiales bacterium]|nr:YegS/Rv2252/BmrU family lipid kinase [Clostridiales bacterium]